MEKFAQTDIDLGGLFISDSSGDKFDQCFCDCRNLSPWVPILDCEPENLAFPAARRFEA